jgi:drug/metabolite transporter (DMT)-like permease
VRNGARTLLLLPLVSERRIETGTADGAVDPSVITRAAEIVSFADGEAARRENLKAAVVMMVGVASFSLMDAGLKILSPHYEPMQVAAIRGLSSLPIVMVWVALSGGFRQLVRVRFPLHIARGLLGIGMLAAFAYGLRHLPLAEAYAIFFVAPLLITAFAVPILGERVGWRRWIAIVVGLCGVLIVLRPTGAGVMTLAGLGVLFAAIGYALSAIAVRILGRTDTTESMVFWLMAIMGGGAALLAMPQWRPIEPAHWFVIGGIALTGSLGQWAITEAFKRGEPSFIAPFEYTALAWATGLDWIVWQKLPGGMTFAGAAVIVASGLYMIRRERRTSASP